MRTYALNRWNWSEKAKKWVYVRKKNGKRIYKYKLTPPTEFDDLTHQMKELNFRLTNELDHDKNMELFQELMRISQKMQAMRS